MVKIQMNAGTYNADVENDLVKIKMNAAGKVYADNDSVVSYDDRTSSLSEGCK